MSELSKINLNLLKSLHALLLHKRVDKAADSQFVTASAMSANLKQLRELLDDELLVRGQASRMHLTEKAKQLMPAVQQALSALSQVFELSSIFDPKKIEAEVSLGLSQYMASIVVPPLLERVRIKAPGVKLVIKNLLEVTTPTVFTNREIDMAFSYFDVTLRHLHKARLFSDRGVLIAPPQHNVWKTYNGTLQSVADCEVVVFTQREKIFAHPKLVHLEKKIPKSCRVNLIVSDLFIALQAAEASHAVTFASERFAKPLLERYLLLAKPLKSPAFPDTKIYWHDILHNDPLCQWLRTELIDCFRE